MSLVHEALQKAGREKLRKTGVQPVPAQKPPPRPAQPLGPAPSNPIQSGATISVARTFAVDKPVDQTSAPGLQKKQFALLPALIICVAVVAIVAIVFLVSLATSAIRDSRQTAHGGGGQLQPMTASTTESRPNEPAPRSVVASEPVGPTTQQPPAPPLGSAAQGFRLTGIMIVPDRNYAAVLNGRVVYESSHVDGATVKKIERESVTLMDAQGKEIVLRLN